MDYIAQVFNNPNKGAGGGIAVVGLLYCLTRRGKRSKKRVEKSDGQHGAPQLTIEEAQDTTAVSRPSSASTNSSTMIYDPQPGNVMDGANARLLEAGSMVCLYTQQGELVTVTKGDRYWELRTISAPTSPAAEGGIRLPFFPVESIFVIVRHNNKVGFRSLGAEGRLLQAVQRPTEPHRVVNYNFGSWESWELSATGLANCRWKHKKLGLEVQELRIMALEDMRRAERQHLHATRELQTKLTASGLQLAETEARLRELVKASQRQAQLSDQQVEEMEHQISESCHREEAMKHELHRKGAALEQFEARLTELSAERDRLSNEIHDKTQQLQCMMSDQQRLREAHTQQLEVLATEMERLHEEGQVQQDNADADNLKLQLVDANNQLAKTREEMEAIKKESQVMMQRRDMDVKVVREERQKLEAILVFIRSHLDTGSWNAIMHQMTAGQDHYSKSMMQLPSGAVIRSAASSAVPPTPDPTDSFMHSFPIFQGQHGGMRDESRAGLLSGTITPTSTVLLDLLTDRCSEINSGIATPRVVDHDEFHRLHCSTEDSVSAAGSSHAASENGPTSPVANTDKRMNGGGGTFGRGIRMNAEQLPLREQQYQTGSAVKEAINRLNSGSALANGTSQSLLQDPGARDRPRSMVDYLSDSMASKSFDVTAAVGGRTWDAPDASSERSDDPGTPSDTSNSTNHGPPANSSVMMKRTTMQPCSRQESPWGGRRSSFLERPPCQGLEDFM